MNNVSNANEGNIIYVQSNDQIYYFDASTWQFISSGGSASGWTLSGNAITNSDFLGSTNNEDFRIRTNDTLRMVVKADDKVGINNENPSGTFQVTTSGGFSPDLTVDVLSNINAQMWYGINLVDDDLRTYGWSNNLNGFIDYYFSSPTLIKKSKTSKTA